MITKHHVDIINNADEREVCVLTHPNVPPWSLRFQSENVGDVSFAAPDLFGCLQELRRWLAARGYRILCNGARVDTWASSMARQMGGARKVYVTRMGKSATYADLVPIFEKASPDQIGSVEEQEAYHAKWMECFQ